MKKIPSAVDTLDDWIVRIAPTIPLGLVALAMTLLLGLALAIEVLPRSLLHLHESIPVSMLLASLLGLGCILAVVAVPASLYGFARLGAWRIDVRRTREAEELQRWEIER